MKNIKVSLLLMAIMLVSAAYSQDDLMITYPTAGIELEPGTEILVEWTGDTTKYKFDLKYSLDDGNLWHNIANNHTKNSVLWEVPDTLTNNCKLKIMQFPFVEAEPKQDWVRTFGGSGEDFAFSVVPTNDGSCLVIGSTSSSDGDLSIDAGEENLLLLKYNINGDLIWYKSYGGYDSEGGRKGIQLDDGSFVIVGYSGTDTLTNNKHHGAYDAWVLKVDSQGEIIWSKSYGGNHFDYFYDVSELENGDLLVVGTTQSDIGDIAGTHGEKDITLSLLDSEGDLLWVKDYGGNSSENDPHLLKNQGNYYISGTTSSTSGQIKSKGYLDDYFLLKLDSSFNIIFIKSYGGSDYDVVNESILSANGGVSMFGFTRSYDGDIVGDTKGQYKISRSWYLDVNQDGIINYSETFDIPFNAIGYSLVRYNNNEILFCGNADGIYDEGFELTGNRDAYLCKTDDEGNISWFVSQRGNFIDSFNSIAIDSENNIFVVGGTQQKNEENELNYDVLVAKYSETKTNSASYTMDEPFSIVKPLLSVEKQIIDVGSVLVKATKDTVVNTVICNEGTANFVLLDLELESDNSSIFQALMQNFVLAPNECSNLEITFSPTEAKDYQADLTLISKSKTYSKALVVIGKGIEEDFNFSFSAAPNSSSDYITVSVILEESANNSIIMYDALGRKIETLHEGEMNKGINTETIKTTSYSSGRYFITYSDDKIRKTIPIEILN